MLADSPEVFALLGASASIPVIMTMRRESGNQDKNSIWLDKWDLQPAIICDAEYIKLTATPPEKKLAVITQIRPPVQELARMRTREKDRVESQSKSFWLPWHLSGSSYVDTWPPELRGFAIGLAEKENSFKNRRQAKETLSRGTYSDAIRRFRRGC